MKKQTKQNGYKADREQPPHGERNNRQARLTLILASILVILFAVFCYAGYRLAKDLLSNHSDKKGFEELAAIVEQSVETTPPHPSETPKPSEAPQATEIPEVTPSPEPTPLTKYAQLYEMNSEFFGWLTIEGLEIDYPIMYAPARSEYYLNRDFYGKYSDSGIPFIDGRCPADGNYYLIYGHKMVNGSVFGRLPRYAEESCWQENPVIRFDTVFEERQYAVMACFYSRLYGGYEPGFRFYEYFDLTSADVFNEYVEQVSVAALYETGVTAEYGDELLVLSTCSHYVEDGRFAVVAKRIA